MTNTLNSSASSPVKLPPSIFSTSRCPTGLYCEAYDEHGVPRPHWQNLLETLDKKGMSALEASQVRAESMRMEDGATINPYDDLTEPQTCWGLDMIPLPLDSREWTAIESGIKQRLALLDKVLADTYGEQLLLKNGDLPPELIYANPSFLHACHGIIPPGDRYLTFYAADLYRGADGHYHVLRDYGSSPAGLGYALENRIVISRIFSDLYHKTQIRRLAPFFKTFHQAFIERSSLHEKDPGIVLFSPGPDSRLYFEHALLSRYLGYQLVEGQDLTVRNGSLFLKKLAGLEQVEAIFRQVDDQNSDPFALRRKDATGVAGLIQVCRENNIDLANPIGAGFIETPALHPFLPSLSEKLLGEPLLLANHPTWWCGNPDSLQYVQNNLATLTLQKAFTTEMQIPESNDLAAQLQVSPGSLIASGPVSPSASPVWEKGGISTGYNLIRVFACATEEGFSVMPGGLAISSDTIYTLLAGDPEKLKSKDIWVQSDEPVELVTMMSSLTSIPEFKRSSDLPNRIADNLLWLGRYLERTEGLIRILRAIFNRLSGEDKPENIPELSFLLSILKAKHVISEIDPATTENSLEMQLHNALYKTDSTESVATVLRRVQNSARNVRDRLSTDCARTLNRIPNFRPVPRRDPLELLDTTLFTLSAFSGLAMESMTRGFGWSFMDLGKRIERAMNLSILIRHAAPQICNDSHNTLQALLEVGDSTMTYRGRYRSSYQLAPVLDLLLADEGNPKSLAFQFKQISSHVEQLPRKNEKHFSSKEERIALDLLTGIRLLDLTGIDCDINTEDMEKVITFLEDTERKLKELGQEVSAHYLTRIPSTPHFAITSGSHSI